ncbi:hypothetical protein C8F04DRAFT_1391661 [Mycena alexandri]|uniref:Uncharacterized protein n=1 Tax=Mycena alexandri TaxID=1745969 RepID=A0AAD6XAH0_9AGAR|nr:hypothetical protein C8F04DRAFT_1391661 [Mycena alexandri]
MAQNSLNSLRQPHPHSVDLLRNRNPDTPLSPFDGTVGAFAQIGPAHYFITTNVDYVPAPPSIETPHKLYLRYGTDDPTLWPQQYTAHYCHMPLIPRKGSRPELDVMWWNPTKRDFVVGSAVTRGLGRLTLKRFSAFLPPVNELVKRCTELRQKTAPAPLLPLFGQLIQHILMWLEQLQTLPTTFIKMVFAVTSLQRAFLELKALYQYMTIYKRRINNYPAPAHTTPAIAQSVGAFTSVPTVAQQLWNAGVPVWLVRSVDVFDRENILAVVPLLEPNFGLPDPDAHAEGAPAALYTGNSTAEKIAVIQRAAIQTPWYHDPFETSITRAPSPSPAPVASTSGSIAQPRHAPSTSAPVASCPLNHNRQSRYKPYPANDPAKAPASKDTAKGDRDKFTALTIPEMPPSIVSMADALTQVDRSVVPYSTDTGDKRYVLPEPALLVNTPHPQRRYKLLHHWSLLADGFIYLLTQHPNPELLSAQQWRDVLDGQMTKRGDPNSRSYKRSESLEDRILLHSGVWYACNVTSLEGFPVPPESVPEFTLAQTREIVWQVAETSFRFEFCALDKRASKKDRLTLVKECFAGHMRTASLMLDWTTKSPRPNIIRHVAEHRLWSPAEMQTLEIAVCRYYTQAFWEHFGRAAVIPMRLDHDLEKEEGEV